MWLGKAFLKVGEAIYWLTEEPFSAPTPHPFPQITDVQIQGL